MNSERALRYRVVDVFTRKPLQGNALAVFPEAGDIGDALMQEIAKELNLSETVFFVPPMRSDCVSGIRIFTPKKEFPTGAYSRMFAPDYGILEDPATGSATGPLAYYMIKHGLISGFSGQGFTSEQGVKMGRKSILHVKVGESGGTRVFEVGGHVVPLADCTMRF